MKTLKQIADEIGIDKQKVYRFVKKNHITASSEVKQSKLYDEAAERLIKSHFDHITTSNERYGEAHQKSGQEQLLEQLIKELQIKNEQIREKDRQIENLQISLRSTTEALASAQESVKVAQLLQANTEQKLKCLEEKESQEEEQNQQPEEKQSFWSRLWHKGN